MFFTALTTEGFFPFWSKSGTPQDMHKIRAQNVQDRQDHCGRQVELRQSRLNNTFEENLSRQSGKLTGINHLQNQTQYVLQYFFS